MNMRPGVYVEHTITKLYSLYNTRALGVVTHNPSGTGALSRFSSLAQARLALAANSRALQMAELFFAHVSGEIFISEIAEPTTTNYLEAMNKLILQKEVYCITTDCQSADFLTQAAVRIATTDKLFVGGAGESSDPAALAQSINSARVCLTTPKIVTASNNWDVAPLLLAVLILRGDNVGGNLIGQAVVGDYSFTEADESAKNSLLYNGVIVFERVDGRTTLIRGVTTCTRDADGNNDTTYRNISVVLAIDSIKIAIATSVERRLGAGTPVSAGSVLALIVGELVDLRDKGVISAYERPVVAIDSADSSVCTIGVNVTINQGINQIYVNINMNI